MKDSIRLLHLEDNHDDAELIKIHLKESGLDFNIKWVQDGDAFQTLLRNEPFDLLLADYSVPGFSGLQALDFAHSNKPQIPFIFVSGSIGEERAIECLKRGAHDYVLKERLARLIPVILRAVADSQIAEEQRRNREELELVRLRERTLLEATRVAGAVPWMLHGDDLTLGDSACPLLGLTREHLPRTIHDLEACVFSEDWHHLKRTFEEEPDGATKAVECRLRTNGNDFLWTRWTCHMSRDSVGGIIQNVQELHELQEQLFQRQKLESLGMLAGRVAHDFNNILQAITSHAEVFMIKFDQNQPQQKFIESILLASQRGMDLVRQLRQFSKEEPVHRLPTSLHVLILEVRELMRETLGNKISLEVLVEPNLPQVMADSSQLHQVLMNLIVNARDALQPFGGTIRIRAGSRRLSYEESVEKRRLHGDYAFIQVEDNGPGIPSEVAAHILDPFFTTKGEKGTGLGLPVICGIAEAHGGWLEFNSTPGVGTQFIFFLPLSPLSTGHDQPEQGGTASKFPALSFRKSG